MRIYLMPWVITVLSVCFPANLRAQQTDEAPAAGRVTADRLSVRKVGGEVEVNFTLHLDSLEVKSNRIVRLTPALVQGDSVRALASVTVAGRRQHIVYRRKHHEGMLVKRAADAPQAFPYADHTSYSDWMDGAQLVLAADLCGCGGSVLSQEYTPLSRLSFTQKPYTVQPALAFMQPCVEAVKHREEHGQAFLDFPVNETVIYPDYRDNARELEKILATINVVKNDSNTRITHISIHGYASPEGSYVNNRRLAQGRAEALKQFVCRQYRFDEQLFTVQSTPEDWVGLQQQVEASNLEDRRVILDVIALNLEEDAKNSRLQRIGGGQAYAYLLKHIYPSLRHSDYTVSYTVRAFSVEEARQLLHTRPQLLSQEEMFRIAATYPAGSPEFNDVFDVAVRLFPDDEVANLNAALVCISEGNYSRAGRYLQKAGGSAQAIHARGVLLLMTGQYDEAEPLLKQAEAAGITQATVNLESLQKKRTESRPVENAAVE